MKYNRLFKLLGSFTKEEFDKFGEFISSPYFNKDEKLITFYKEIKDYHPDFSDELLTKEKIYTRILGRESYNDSSMRNWLQGMNTKAEEFLSFQRYMKNETTKSDNLLNELSDRNLLDHFRKSSKSVSSALEDIKASADTWLMNDLYRHEVTMFNHRMINFRIHLTGDVQTLISHLSNASIYLSYFYITELHNIYCNSLSFSGDYKIKNNPCIAAKLIRRFNVPAVIKDIKEDNEFGFLLDIYSALFNSFEGIKSDGCYGEYKRIFFKNIDKLSPDEKSFHFSKLISYCINNLHANGNNKKYDNELFSLYRTQLKKEFYKNKKSEYLPHDLFRNILLHSIHLKKDKWTLDFIKNYSGKVHPNDAENMYNFGLSVYYCSGRKYRKALDYLNNFKDENFIYMVDTRALLLKTYYVLEEYEPALSLIKSLQVNLPKNPLVSEARKIRYKNFLYYSNKLFLFRAGNERVEIDYEKVKMEKSDVLHKDWLIEKMNEIIGLKRAG